MRRAKRQGVPRPTEAELSILSILWQRGPCTVRDVHEVLSKREHTGYTTALKLLQVMHAKGLVELARVQVANLVNAKPAEIIWTSGATESDNLAIKGAAHFYKKKGRHIVTLKTEHKAVLDSCRQLEREGYEVTYLDPEPSGLLDLDKFRGGLGI